MYDTLLNRAAEIGRTVVSKPIGQMLLDYTEKCLWTVEKSVEWCMLPEQKTESKDRDVSSSEIKEPTATTLSEKSEDMTETESEAVRPLPWVLFLPLLVCLKAAKTSIDVCSYMLSRESLEPSYIVEFIHTGRNMLKEMKDQIKSNQEEEKIEAEPSNELSTHTRSSDKPEKQEIQEIQAVPEKEVTTETVSKTETEPVAAPAPEAALPSELQSPSVTSPVPAPADQYSTEETAESETGNDTSSSTLEASLTEKEDSKDDTKEEDEDFQSVKSSSTYFTPDSSYSLQSINEEPKASDTLSTESENETIAAAIEEIRALSVTDEAPMPTPTTSLSSSTSSLKQTETSRKRSFSSFFQVRRKNT